jgi:hypothetical protein
MKPLVWIQEHFRTTLRGAAEFAIVVAAFAVCDPTPVSLVVGGAVALAGEFLRIMAAGYGYNVGELSISGPYRFVRHPYFLGSTLLFLGICIAARQPYVMGFAIFVLTLMYRREFRRGEERLAKYLGPRFAEYKDRVPAFLPQLFPARDNLHDKHSFSLEYAILKGRHRELDALLGLALGFGLLFLGHWVTSKDLFHLGIVVTVGLYLVGRFIYFGVARRRAAKGRLASA